MTCHGLSWTFGVWLKKKEHHSISRCCYLKLSLDIAALDSMEVGAGRPRDPRTAAQTSSAVSQIPGVVAVVNDPLQAYSTTGPWGVNQGQDLRHFFSDGRVTVSP